MKNKITIFDIMIIILLILFLTGFVVLKFFNFEKGKVLIIEADGEKFNYDITVDRVYEIEGVLGVTIIEVKNRAFRFVESPCAGKDCIHQGTISIPDVPVVCLPNKVSAYIKSENKEMIFDGITQ